MDSVFYYGCCSSALACFLLFLLYPQNEPNETADNPTIESPMKEVSNFSELFFEVGRNDVLCRGRE